jgi:RimJ/RimL family protein N-acetyltransferase
MALQWIKNSKFHGEDKKKFWILLESVGKVGLIQLYDLFDSTPMFDLRIRTEYRRMGIGRQALVWLTRYVFSNFPNAHRIEAHTRQDNIAML